MELGQKEETGGRLWVVTLVLSLCLNFAFCLAIVAFSTQRTQLGYSLKETHAKLTALHDHSSKLEVERDLLLSPYSLEKKAAEFGMRNAKAGEIRKLD